jgi:hypothetical protein
VRLALVLAALVLAAQPAVAVETALAAPAEAQLAPEIDKTLWCASAFFWLSADADDSGNDAEAEMYSRWSGRLITDGTAALTAAGFGADVIEQTIAFYDDAVLTELGTPASRFNVEDCPALANRKK